MKKFLFLKKAEFSHSKNDLVLFNFIFNLKRLSKGISKIFLVFTLLLAILFCKNNSYAQTEPVFSKKSSWSEIRSYDPATNIYVIHTYKLEGDTIIGGKIYSKLFQDNNYYVALRESEDHKIYCYFPYEWTGLTHEILIYDFDWYPNKTLYNESTDPYFCPFMGDSNGCIEAVLGNTIDSIQLLDGKYYQYTNYYGWNVIKGIGSVRGFFYDTFIPVTCFCPADLLCFYIDDELVYLSPNYDDCDGNSAKLISGKVTMNGEPLEGVEISYYSEYNVVQGSTFTDEEGYYSIPIHVYLNLTITPNLTNFVFDPPKIELFKITQDIANNNFAATYIPPIKYTVSGTVKIDETTPLEDVTISYTGGYEQTDQYGYYEFEVEENSEIIITPTFSGFSFYPTSDTIIVTNNTTVNFTAIEQIIKYTVSGTVKIDETTPLEDVTISYTGGYEQTDQYGYYEFEIEENSEIIITPTFSGFSFYPTSDTIIVTNNTTVNFTAYTIGISQLQNTNSELQVYPNPTIGQITVDYHLDRNIRTAQLNVIDQLGVTQLTQSLNTGQTTVDIFVGRLVTGTYTIQLVCDGAISDSKNFIKQ